MDIYLIIVIILFALAISDLIVGVSNDAVNFLNSAIGSRVAPKRIIFFIASMGILVGTLFSSGLMEVARKGIFHPDQFLLPEIMVIFLAVMITDVLLLDLFNTFGLPTSTTVSIVFELLGAAVAVSMIKIFNAGQGLDDLVNYINTSKALAIIGGILLSVFVAFSVGAILQYLIRLLFTFEFSKQLKRYGALFGGAAITAITFFILIKGAKGASFLTAENQAWIKDNTNLIILISFAGWSVIFQFLRMFTNINILKPVVLTGTFALALAFAANDLVNFIGVPLAGLSTYMAGIASGNPEELIMTALKQPVQTDTILLLLAGLIMILALIFSKKAQSVTKTEVNLGRQSMGFERFESSLISRIIVRMSVRLADIIKSVTPISIQRRINDRFDSSKAEPDLDENGQPPAFDMLRASVNLMIASVLISFATSLKLPLSTTYVTFMVAMGTSLSDRAWGRESAVYRVNGVLTVIGGWFMTALLAFSISAVFATTIYFGGIVAILILVSLAALMVYRTYTVHKNREKQSTELETAFYKAQNDFEQAISVCRDETNVFLNNVKEIIGLASNGLATEDRESLRSAQKSAKKLNHSANSIVSKIFETVKMLDGGSDESKRERRYGKATGAIQEITANLRSFAKRCFDHVDNMHAIPNNAQLDELQNLLVQLDELFGEATELIGDEEKVDLTRLKLIYDELEERLSLLNEMQISLIRENSSTPRSSLLMLRIFSDMENISNFLVKLTKAFKKEDKAATK